MCQQSSQLGIRDCNCKEEQLLSHVLFSKSAIPLVFLECLQCGRLQGCFKLEKNATKTFKILCVLDRASSWYLNKGWPTWWHLLYYLLLNMFQTLIRPSSWACDYLLRCVGWLEACWCYVAGLSVGDVVFECRLNHYFQNVWSNFCRAENGKNATFCKVFLVHFECFLRFVTSCTLYWRCWMLGMSNKHKS